jgi:hypothetical protein
MQTKDKKAAPPVVADLSVEPTCWSRAVPEMNGATFLLKGAISRDRKIVIPLESDTTPIIPGPIAAPGVARHSAFSHLLSRGREC